jgi:hypothetical protein
VHGAVGEQGEDGGANVTATRPWPTSAASAARPEARTEVESPSAGELLVAMAPGMARVAM